MTQIGAIDQVVLLLREQLQRSERARGARRSEERPATPQQRLAALATVRDLPDRDFRRAVVRGLLGERLGEALAADPAFEAMSAEVLRIIDASDEGRALLDRVVAEFRGG